MDDEKLAEMESLGFRGGKVRISHVCSETLGNSMAARITSRWPGADVAVTPAGALCGFCAERGGLLVGFGELETE